MKCAWEQFLAILPPDLRTDADKLGKQEGQELRLRLGSQPRFVLGTKEAEMKGTVTAEHLNFVINTASRYSPWSAASAASGYITAPGGHRIGIFGEAVVRNGTVAGIRRPTSLCVRIARDFPGIAARAAKTEGNILIVGPPGSGKTTLLRDLIRQISDAGKGSVSVVDERGELFPPVGGFGCGARTDVLTGCAKPQGVEMALKTMGPSVIAVDEITSESDCDALEQALWCGVRIIATAHAADRQDLMGRRAYRRLTQKGLFDWLMILQRDKSWRMERM